MALGNVVGLKLILRAVAAPSASASAHLVCCAAVAFGGQVHAAEGLRPLELPKRGAD